jgi:cytochrome c peroxidase
MLARRRWLLAAALVLLWSGATLGESLPGPSQPVEPITPIPPPPAADPRKLALGERLFRDVQLSGDDSVSCASCHDVRSNGAGALERPLPADDRRQRLNTPTVFNAALSFRYGWEGSFRTLEDQVAGSMADPAFMASSIDQALTKLKHDPDMVRQFTEAYGHGPDGASLTAAIAEYERSLVTPDSRFDRWLQGDTGALTPQEQEGYRLFRSMGCISCHQGANVGGNLFERHGIFHPLAAPKPEILRVPSLRNVAMTPPYFHDGSAPTLDDAVRKMGYAQLDQNLTEDEVSAIVAFLGTLTGNYRGAAVAVDHGSTAP